MATANPYGATGTGSTAAVPGRADSRMLHLRRIDVLSAGKVLGAIYVVFGLIAGLPMSLIALLSIAIGAGAGEGGVVFGGAMIGVLAIVFYPLFFGLMGFIGGMIGALIYNLVAGMVGGLVLEFEA